jgi:hypothetical protein
MANASCLTVQRYPGSSSAAEGEGGRQSVARPGGWRGAVCSFLCRLDSVAAGFWLGGVAGGTGGGVLGACMPYRHPVAVTISVIWWGIYLGCLGASLGASLGALLSWWAGRAPASPSQGSGSRVATEQRSPGESTGRVGLGGSRLG